MIARRALGLGLWAALAFGSALAAQESAPVYVEPGELATREDLVGKRILVDDRLRFFQFHQRAGYDELYLKRTDVPFRLPPELRPESPPRAPAVTVQGRLSREGSLLHVVVESFTLQAADQERLDKAVAALPAREYENRKRWALWALRRADEFKDDPLRRRARAIQADALRIEAESKRTGVDAPREWLALATKARRSKVAEPGPSALAHRAFRALLADAKTPEDLKKLQEEIAGFFPEAPRDQAAAAANLAAWNEPYAADPAAAYKDAPPPVRAALDRRLWVDATAKWLESRVGQDVSAAIQLVDQAKILAPERPELATGLIEQAVAAGRRDLTALRLEQVRTLGALLKDRANRPDAALELYRDWLSARKNRLGDADAEGRVALATNYDELLHDDQGARDLLDAAWRIAPGSEVVSNAYKLRGYRREGDDWTRDAPAGEAAAAPNAAPANLGLLGKTPDEVRASLATEPTSKSFVATRGRLVEQWLFLDTRQRRFVNFLRRPGEPNPRVVSDYFLPR